MHLNTPLSEMQDAERRVARNHASFMELKALPISPQARSLINSIVDTVVCPFQKSKGQVRATMIPKYHEAASPFIADLLLAAQQERWGGLATRNADLVTYPGGRAAFTTTRGAMEGAGLLEHMKGFSYPTEKKFGHTRNAALTSFRPTARLVLMAESAGVSLSDLSIHFGRRKGAMGRLQAPEGPLSARATKIDQSVQGLDVPIGPHDLKARAIRERMDDLNNHLMGPGRVDGIVFNGLRRIFSNADRPAFAWQWGGRFYSMKKSDRYENLSGMVRAERVRLDGEQVIEVDISASHLCILHGLLGLQFDGTEDPYALHGRASREGAKWFVTRSLGKSDGTIGGKRYKVAREACLERYPFLADLPTLGISTLDLQYHESEIMLLAMEELRDLHGIGFLPVHDALIVPKSKTGLAADALVGAFSRYFMGTLGMSCAPVPNVH